MNFSIKDILEIPFLYQVWQAPFIKQKSAPYLSKALPVKGLNVVELGCGPGTNAALFADSNYFGFDLSPEYVATAKKTYPHQSFFVADVGASSWIDSLESCGVRQVDLVFINSLLHHLDDVTLNNMLINCSVVLRDTGFIHITDLILPANRGIPRFLANADRGDYPRSERQWLDFISCHFEMSIFNTFYLKLFGINLWYMFYFKGISKRNRDIIDA